MVSIVVLSDPRASLVAYLQEPQKKLLHSEEITPLRRNYSTQNGRPLEQDDTTENRSCIPVLKRSDYEPVEENLLTSDDTFDVAIVPSYI